MDWCDVDWRVACRCVVLGLGIFINETTGEFPQKEQELFEGIVAVIAVVILTDGFLDAQSVAQRQSTTGAGSR